MTKRLTVEVSHGGCAHRADSWNHAFSMAINHANKTMTPQSRGPVIRMLMAGDNVWHQGVLFTGRIVK